MTRASREDELRSLWRGLIDGPKAVSMSQDVLDDIIQERLDPVRYFSLFVAAIDPQADGPNGDLSLFGRALKHSRQAFTDAEGAAAEAAGCAYPIESVVLRSNHLYLEARYLHLGTGSEREALRSSYDALFHIGEAAERRIEELDAGETDEAPQDREDAPADCYWALERYLSSPVETQIAQCGVASISIHAASLKKNADTLKPATFARLLAIIRRLVKAYILDEDGVLKADIPAYPKTDALAAQCLYLFLRYGDLETDRDLVTALYALDCRTRPDDRRAAKTICLREMEWAWFLGDVETAERYEAQALNDLADIGGRQLRVVQAYGWVRPPRYQPA